MHRSHRNAVLVARFAPVALVFDDGHHSHRVAVGGFSCGRHRRLRDAALRFLALDFDVDADTDVAGCFGAAGPRRVLDRATGRRFEQLLLQLFVAEIEQTLAVHFRFDHRSRRIRIPAGGYWLHGRR